MSLKSPRLESILAASSGSSNNSGSVSDNSNTGNSNTADGEKNITYNSNTNSDNSIEYNEALDEVVCKILKIIRKYYKKLDHKITIYRLKRQNNIINSPRYNTKYSHIYTSYKRRLNRNVNRELKKHKVSRMQIIEYIDNSILKLIFNLHILVEMEQNNKLKDTQRVTAGLNNLHQIKHFIYHLMVTDKNKFHNMMTGDVTYIHTILSKNKEMLIREYSIDYKIVGFLEAKGYNQDDIINGASGSSKPDNKHKRLEKISQMLSYYNSSSLGNYYDYYYTDITRTFKLRTLDLWCLMGIYQ